MVEGGILRYFNGDAGLFFICLLFVFLLIILKCYISNDHKIFLYQT